MASPSSRSTRRATAPPTTGLVTIPEIIDAIRTVGASRGRLAGLVAHSAGALTAAHALHDGLAVGAAVFVAPPADLHGAAARFTETLGFSRAARERMRERIAARVGRPVVGLRHDRAHLGAAGAGAAAGRA
jgi:hypothetical protein